MKMVYVKHSATIVGTLLSLFWKFFNLKTMSKRFQTVAALVKDQANDDSLVCGVDRPC